MKAAAATLAISFFLSACGRGTRMDASYQGTLVRRGGGHVVQELVTLALNPQRNAVDAKDTQGKTIGHLELSDLGSGRFAVSVPDLRSNPYVLQRAGDCFVSASKDATLCLANHEFFFEIDDSDGMPIFSLSGEDLKNAPVPQFEVPRSYTWKELHDRLLSQNYDIRLEFQNLLQARARASHGYIKTLTPRVSFNSVPPLIVQDMAGTMAAIGDLAPFALPNRWFQARQNAIARTIETDAMAITRGEALLNLDGLLYSFDRDQQIVTLFSSIYEKASWMQQYICESARSGLYPESYCFQINAIVASIQHDGEEAKLNVEQEDHLLAQTLAFHNPEAISGYDVPPDFIPIAQAQVPDSKSLIEAAVARSFEIQQAQQILDMARAGHKHYFDWLDPQIDPSLELGLNLITAIKVAKSQENQAETRLKQTNDQVTGAAADCVSQLSTALLAYSADLRAVEADQRVMDLLMEGVRTGTNIDGFALTQTFQTYLQAKITLLQDLTTYHLARSNLNRLLLQGPYTHLLDEESPAGR